MNEAVLRHLQEDVEDLKEQVAQLRSAFAPQFQWPDWMPALTKRQRDVLSMLVKRQCVTRAMFEVLCPNSDNPDKMLDHYICKLREKLTPHGVTIITERGVGYYLDAGSKAMFPNAPIAILPPKAEIVQQPASGMSLREIQLQAVRSAVSRHAGRISDAAAELQVAPSTIYRMLGPLAN